MDDIFRKSNLYRDKWDEKRGEETYGNITINTAIESCQNEFVPETTDDDFQIFIMDEAIKPAKENRSYSYDDTGNAERLKDKFERTFVITILLVYGCITTVDAGRMMIQVV